MCVSDNDFGADGGECIGVALGQNETLKSLRISENDLKSEGAIPIINSAYHVEQLNLAKNFLKSDVGKPLQKLLKNSKYIKVLNLEFNELMVQGIKSISQGLVKNNSLEVLNVKGNIIGDQGMIMLA